MFMNPETHLLHNSLYYGLTQKKMPTISKKIITSSIPNHSFGVFTTIRRNKNLSHWPTDIHGCIGYWDQDFKTLNKNTLLNHTFDVTYKAIHTDERKHYFPSLIHEPSSIIEIDFLMKPLYAINPQNGTFLYNSKKTRFNNNIFGIILQSTQSKQRATFLPHVFENKSWKSILTLLMQKANVRNPQEIKLYAYKIIQYKMPLLNLLENTTLIKHNIQSFVNILFHNLNLNNLYIFLYSVNQNKKQTFDDSQHVRNCALLGSIYHMYKNHTIKLNKTQLKQLKNNAAFILQNIDSLPAQAISFLHPFITKKNIPFCYKLIDKLPHAGEEFEKPEILIGLKNAGCIIPKNLSKIYFAPNNSIFQFNWNIQTYYFLHNSFPPTLLRQFETKVQDILKKIQNEETNVLAVSLESLCYVYKKTRVKKWLSLLFPLFIELELRKDNVLYPFHSGESRIDISDHIYRGLALLIT